MASCKTHDHGTTSRNTHARCLPVAAFLSARLQRGRTVRVWTALGRLPVCTQGQSGESSSTACVSVQRHPCRSASPSSNSKRCVRALAPPTPKKKQPRNNAKVNIQTSTHSPTSQITRARTTTQMRLCRCVPSNLKSKRAYFAYYATTIQAIKLCCAPWLGLCPAPCVLTPP